MKFRTIVLLITIMTISLSGQESENYKTSAISFSFNGFNLDEYYGGVGGRFWLSNLLTLNISVNGGVEDTDEDYVTSEDRIDDENRFVKIGFGIEKHFTESDNISPYLSGRLFFGWNETYYKLESDNHPNYTEQTNTFRNMGIELGFGVEYWILERISLSGQHLFNFTYSNSEIFRFHNSDNVMKSTSYNFNFGTTLLMISIYF